jgi:hypothetical protein
VSIERRPTQRLAKLRDLIDRDAYEINLDRLAKKLFEAELRRLADSSGPRD